jgi:hypothetical protein
VFALQHIKRGTRIIVEEPLFAITPPQFIPGQGYPLAALIADIEKSFARLSRDHKAEYLSCHEHRDEGDVESREVVIFRNNAYTLSDGTIGIFPKIAKINHSCHPNSANVFVGTTGRRIIWAGRDILAGEEITVTYVPLLQSTEARRSRLLQYGFLCNCDACTSGLAGDHRREEIGKSLAQVEDIIINSNSATASLLSQVEELARLVEEDHLTDYLARVYRCAAYTTLRLNDFVASRQWALKELEIHSFADENSPYAQSTKEFLGQVS